MKKHILKLSLIALLGFGLFACGNDDTSSASSTPASSNTTSSVATSSTASSSSSSSKASSNSSSSSSSSVAEENYNYGTQEKPLTIAETLELAAKQCPSDKNYTKQVIFAKGKVATQPDYSGKYIKTFTLKDTKSEDTIVVSTLNKKEGVADPDQNDEIVLSGYVRNSSGVYQFGTYNKEVYVNLLSCTKGTSTVTSSGDNCTIAGLPETGVNGSTFNFTVTPDETYQIDKVIVNDKEVTANDGTYTGTIAGNTLVKVLTSKIGSAKPVSVGVLSFATDTNRTEFTTSKQVWSYKGITFTHEKAKSTNDLVNNVNPIRCYKSSSIKIEYNGMSKIIITCNSKDYANALLNSTYVTECTKNSDAKLVTIEFAEPVDALEISSVSGQVRIDQIEVFKIKEKAD